MECKAPQKEIWKLLPLREPFSSGSHLLGAIAATLGAIYLIYASNGTTASILVILLYGLALTGLFLVSGLFHGLTCSTETLRHLERCDYAAIYLFIAGTYTPVCLFALHGSIGFWLFICEWALALCGVWLCLHSGPARRFLQVAIFLSMGWSFLFVLPSLDKSLAPLPFNFLILGGVFYSVGAIIFALDWPHLARRRFSAHDFWHVLVLLGAASHFILMTQIVSAAE